MLQNRIVNLTALMGLIAISFAWLFAGQESTATDGVSISTQSGTIVEVDLEDRQDSEDVRPSMLIPTERSIAMFSARVERNPADFRSASILARLYMRQAKENDDFDGFLRAESVLRKVLKENPEWIAEKVYLAEALMAQHRFSEAKELATNVLREKGGEMARATLGDSQMHLGEYESAKETFALLLKENDSPPVLVRMARIKELYGRNDEAIELIEQAAKIQSESAGEPSTEAWYRWRLGQSLWNAGYVDRAEAAFAEATRLNSEDAAAWAGLAMVSASRGHFSKSIELYERAIGFSEEPPILVALGDVFAKMGKDKERDRVFERAAELMDEESRHPQAGPAHARERAQFFVNHDLKLKEALVLAKNELKIRQDVFTFDLLAWALYKNGDLEEAAKASAMANALGTKDSTLLFHTGMIQAAQGQDDLATKSLSTALKINPNFSVFDAEMAKSKLEELVQTKGQVRQ